MLPARKIVRYSFEVLVTLFFFWGCYWVYQKWQAAKTEEKPPVIYISNKIKCVKVTDYKGNEIFAVYKNDTCINVISITPNKN